MAKKVTAIPPTINRVTAQPLVGKKEKRKVAGYARVSTDSDEQASSYEAQMEYYTEYIGARDDWEFVGMYSDEGISATSTKRRDGFNTMVEDALAGKIDLIITKSVSRFARNTVDSLSTIRKLKEKDTEVYFEKENIWTFDAKGELFITIMSSLAQEESRSISENTTWGRRKSFADGTVTVAYTRVLGYGKDFEIIEEQAETVRLIFKLFLDGLSCYAICRKLENLGRETACGKKRWHQSTVISILENEKYKGDGLLQKTYTADFLTHKRVANDGQLKQYYVEDHHEGIVDEKTFELAQAEMRRRRGHKGEYSGTSIFSSKIVCGDCGCFFGSKVWHSKDKYRRVIWRCNHKYSDGHKCSTPHITEDEIKSLFLKALNKLLEDKNGIIEDLTLLRTMATEVNDLKTQAEELSVKENAAYKTIEDLIEENAITAQDQGAYNQKYEVLLGEYERIKAEHKEVADKIELAHASDQILGNFISMLQEMDGCITDFEDRLWAGAVESMTIHEKGKATVTFKGGIKVEV